MDTAFKKILFLFFFLICAKAKSQILITGWHLPVLNQDEPSLWLSSDPVLGRLICPGFSRFNEAKKSSDSLIFQNVKIERLAGNKVRWIYGIKSGLYWWDASKVLAKEIAEYLKNEIPQAIAEKSKSSWKVPSHQVKELDLYEVEILWDQEPSFGPYVLNDRPFFKKLDHKSFGSFSYQCAGLYHPHEIDADIQILEPTKGYTLSGQKISFSTKPLQLAPNKAALFDTHLQFNWAQSHSLDPSKRPPHLPVACSGLVPTHWITGILWKDTEQTKNAPLRRLISQILPRQSLLQSGAGFWGEAASSLFPSHHPFAPSKSVIKDLSFEEIEQVFRQLGYEKKLSEKMGFFFNQKTGKPLQLSFYSPHAEENPSSFVPERVLMDALNLIGVDTVKSTFDKADIYLSGFYLPLPQMDLFSTLELASHDEKQAEIKALLEKHSLQMSYNRFDASVLEKIHQSLDELELLSVIMHHKSCLKVFKSSQDMSASILKGLRFDDPDWLRKMLF